MTIPESPSAAPEKPKIHNALNILREKRESQIQAMKLGDFLKSSPEERLTGITNPPLLPSSLQEDMTVQFNFYGNKGLERQISLADVMPAAIREVTVTHEGKALRGTRRGISGEFFAENNKRLEIFTGTAMQIHVINENQSEFIDQNEVAKYQPKTGEEIDIVQKALAKGVDPELLLDLHQTRHGTEKGLYVDSGKGIESFDLQLEMIVKIIGRYEGNFAREYPNIPIRNEEGRYTAEFFTYFTERYISELKLENSEDFAQEFVKMYAPEDLEFLTKGRATLEQKRQERVGAYYAAEIPEIREQSIDQLDDFMWAISQQESGEATDESKRYIQENPRTAAHGKYQIMPKNWPSWSEEAGLPEGSRPTPENQEIVARFKMAQSFEKYQNWVDVASEWYSGGPYYEVLEQKRENKRYGDGSEPSIKQYVAHVMTRLQQRLG